MKHVALVATFILCMGSTSQAQDFSLGFPLECDLGKDCYIQQYVDHDFSKRAADFQCGALSYDGHKGTDFALPTLRAMREGVNVIAAASGRVKALRNGIDDTMFTQQNASKIKGRECGNGIVLQHHDGWETQYCHLKNGSLTVKRGQIVHQGSVLGQVGLSGRTQFPHLHFSLRRDGQTIDPFAPEKREGCATKQETSLWQKPISYQAGGILEAGFSSNIPEFSQINDGFTPPTQLPETSSSLVVFAYGYGAQKGDRLHIKLSGPQGVVAEHTHLFKRNIAKFMKYTGKPLNKSIWPSGQYIGEFALWRAGEMIDVNLTSIEIIPNDTP